MMGPHFDESMAALRELRDPLLASVAVALVTGVALASFAAHRARARWTMVTSVARGGPYRGVVLHTHARGTRNEVPWPLRATAMSCFAFGNLFVPSLVFALSQFRFDGIAVPLIPGVAIAAATWACGWLLVGRSRAAPEIVRAAAVISLVLHVAMLALSAAHLMLVEGESPVHECSSSFAFITLVFAAAAVAQALVMLLVLRKHRGVYELA